MIDPQRMIEEIGPTLDLIEQDRQTYLAKRKAWVWTVLTPGLLIAGIPAILFFPTGLVALLVWGLAAGVIYIFMAGKLGKAYVRSYKNAVTGKAVSLLDSRLSYAADRGIEESEFAGSELFGRRSDRYHSEDLIHGEYRKTFLKLAEIHAEEERTTTDSDGSTSTEYVTIFKGLLLIADFHKHFLGRTFVLPDIAEKTFGSFGRSLQKLGGRRGTSLIQMDDAEFERAFAVHSTDQVECRYILSPAMMRRLLDLRSRFGNDVRIAFKDSSVWIAVPHSLPYLEPKTKIPATDRGQIQRMLTEILSVLDIVEELDLNTRIWTKD